VSWTERSEDSDLWFLLGLARAQSSPQAESHYVFPFYTWSWTRYTQPKPEGQASVAVGAGGAAGTAVAGAGSAGDVPAVTAGKPTAKEILGDLSTQSGTENAAQVPIPAEPVTSEEEQFRFVYLLYDTLDRTSSDGGAYHRTRVLWRLWHDESTEEGRALDVFPFFTYDRKGDDSLSWSWLYTFLRYERKGDEAALNLFFLPAIPL
jgi:hypothetical protein